MKRNQAKLMDQRQGCCVYEMFLVWKSRPALKHTSRVWVYWWCRRYHILHLSALPPVCAVLYPTWWRRAVAPANHCQLEADAQGKLEVSVGAFFTVVDISTTPRRIETKVTIGATGASLIYARGGDRPLHFYTRDSGRNGTRSLLPCNWWVLTRSSSLFFKYKKAFVCLRHCDTFISYHF